MLNSSRPLIEARGLVKTWRGARRPALQGVSLAVGPGEVLGVIGPNGSGKTTLMGCLLGLLRPEAGEARVGGQPAGSLEAKRLLGYLPERLRFDPWMKGWDFLAFHAELAGLPQAGRAEALESLLREVGLEAAAWGRPLRGYSRGMLQRLGLAQALVGRPDCLFLDEPTSGLDPEGVLRVRERVRAFAADGGAVVLNSHQLDQVARLCTRIVFLKEGQVQAAEALAAASGRRPWAFAWLPSAGGAARALGAARGLGLEARPQGERRLLADLAEESEAAALLKALGAAGLEVCAAGPLQEDLERHFAGEGARVQ